MSSAARYFRAADPERTLSPLEALLRAGGVSLRQLELRSTVTYKSLRVLADDGDEVYRQPLSTLIRVSLALGVAPVELLPVLGRRPAGGLLQEAGVIPPPKRARGPQQKTPLR